jgi:hypothetical protein
LHGSPLRLMISHTVEVEGEKCHTASYAYRLMTAEAKDAWILRWEYFRRPPRSDYPYPLAHVHANAAATDSAAEALLRKPLPHAHIPTARVPIELVFWHLIAEWDVQPKRDDWQDTLTESLSGYEERRTAP